MKKPLMAQTWFAIAAFLGVEAVTIFSGLFYIHQQRAQILHNQARSTAIHVQDVVRDHVNPQDLQPPYPSDFMKKLRHFETDLRTFLDIFRVKIFSPEGTIIWSDERRLIGQRFPHEDLRKAFRGEVVSEVKSPNEGEHKYEQKYAHFMEVYVPIAAEPGGDTVAVVEAYLDVTNLMSEVRKGQATIIEVALLSGALIFLIPLFIMRRANRVQEALEKETRKAKEYLRSLIEDSLDAIISTDKEGKVVLFNKGAEVLLGYRREEVFGQRVTILYESEERAKEVMRQMRERGDRVAGFETILRAKDGSHIPVLISASILYDEYGQEAGTVGFNKDLRERKRAEEELLRTRDELELRVEERTADLRKTNEELESEVTERKRAEEELLRARDELERRVEERTAELEATHRELVESARKVGMAEVATGVLHNVGNVLNSVSVTTASMSKIIRNSRSSYLSNVVEMLEEHADDLGAFITTDERGRRLPTFIAELSNNLTVEQERLLEAVEKLTDHVGHITEIINLQQSYGRISGLNEPVLLSELMEDALRINGEGMIRHDIEIHREYAQLPPALFDGPKVLQILTNLISNAKYALMENGGDKKILTLHIKEPKDGLVRIEVSDNGSGIAQDNLTRIFSYGFTTRKEGHGFGLHSGALAAKEMEGTLSAHSDGPGRGATFTLELPFRPDGSKNA